MAEAILVPQVGQDLTEAKVVALNVKVGDPVKKGDIVAEVESEKASFEVEAFVEGVVLELRYAEGDVATVLEPLLVVGALGETPAEAGGGGPADALQVPPPDKPAKAAPAAAPEPAPAIVAATASASAALQPRAASGAAASGALRSSPLARRVARDNGLDIGALEGSGPRGAVVIRDVEARLAASGVAAPAVVSSAPVAMGAGVHVRTLRDGAGHPVVFVHGFGADLSAWRPFVGRLGIRNPAVGVDLPGHGASAGVPAARFADLVDRVADGLLAAGHTRLHLVGHSVGGAVAAGLADHGDLDVRSLTLLAPAGLGARIDGDFVDGFLGARSEAALARWMERLVYDPASLPGALIRATLAAREAGPLVAAQGAVATSLFEGGTQLFSIRDALERFPGPCRAILGRRDAILSSAESEAALPGHVAVHRLARTGHLPQLEAGALVSRLVDETVRAAG